MSYSKRPVSKNRSAWEGLYFWTRFLKCESGLGTSEHECVCFWMWASDFRRCSDWHWYQTFLPQALVSLLISFLKPQTSPSVLFLSTSELPLTLILKNTVTLLMFIRNHEHFTLHVRQYSLQGHLMHGNQCFSRIRKSKVCNYVIVIMFIAAQGQ